MGMMEEIEKLMNCADSSINYRIINLGGKFLYIEGINSVVCFSEEEMRFQLKKHMLVICGNKMKIKYLDKNSCVIEGEVKGVEMR